MNSSVDEMTPRSSEAVAKESVKLLLEKLGQDVKLYDVRDSEAITDFYVVATGRSLTHVASLADELCERLSQYGWQAARIEGKRGNSWILVDYLDVIVNIFDKESRGFYNFDRLMPKESEGAITELVSAVDKKFEQ